MALSVFGFAAYQAWISQPVVGIILTVLLVGFLFTLVNESKGLSAAKTENLFSQKNLLTFVAVVVGALVAYTLNYNLKLGAVLAASIVGLVGGFLVKDYATPLYVGSFIGMSAKALLAGHGQVAVAAVIAGIVYILTLAVFGGFGGKAGTIAVVGSVLGGLVVAGKFGHPAVPGWNVGWQLLVVSLVASVASFYLNNNLKQGPVIGSAAVGLVAGLIGKAVPSFGPLATMAICASFLGMSNTKRFPSILPLGLAGLVVGLVYMFSAPFLGGAGGKLGCTCLGSGMAMRGLMDLVGKKK
jgi:hypothetical protein